MLRHTHTHTHTALHSHQWESCLGGGAERTLPHSSQHTQPSSGISEGCVTIVLHTLHASRSKPSGTECSDSSQSFESATGRAGIHPMHSGHSTQRHVTLLVASEARAAPTPLIRTVARRRPRGRGLSVPWSYALLAALAFLRG
jgi:hypothetical protein